MGRSDSIPLQFSHIFETFRQPNSLLVNFTVYRVLIINHHPAVFQQRLTILNYGMHRSFKNAIDIVPPEILF